MRPTAPLPGPTGNHPSSSSDALVPAPARPRPAARRALVAGAVTAVAIVVAVAVAVVRSSGPVASAQATSEQPVTATATVVRRDLVRTVTIDGTTGYPGSRAIAYRSSPAAAGSGAGAASSGASGASGSGTSGGSGGSGTSGASGPSGASTATTTPATGNPSSASSSSSSSSSSAASPSGGQGQGAPAQAAAADSSGPAAASPASGATGASSPSTTSTTARATSSTAASSPAATGGPSTRSVLTWVPPDASVVGRGDVVYRVDQAPTILLEGTTPAWRQLDTSSTAGPDVRQLEQNLVASGYGGGITVDDTFDAATAYQLAAWEKAVGLDGDGVLQLGEVVFEPGPVRVTSASQAVGTVISSGASVLQVTDVELQVQAAIDTRQQAGVGEGTPVQVSLAGGAPAGGRVESVGRDAASASTGQASANAPLVDKVTLTIALDPAAAGDDGGGARSWPASATVKVTIAVESRTGVLAVPPSALRTVDGRPAVTIVAADGARSSVPVEAGMVADGQVEIRRGVSEGRTVALG